MEALQDHTVAVWVGGTWVGCDVSSNPWQYFGDRRLPLQPGCVLVHRITSPDPSPPPSGICGSAVLCPSSSSYIKRAGYTHARGSPATRGGTAGAGLARGGWPLPRVRRANAHQTTSNRRLSYQDIFQCSDSPPCDCRRGRCFWRSSAGVLVSPTPTSGEGRVGGAPGGAGGRCEEDGRLGGVLLRCLGQCMGCLVGCAGGLSECVLFAVTRTLPGNAY